MMRIETDRLIIREIAPSDAGHFIEMASDGSLYDIGFDRECHKWMDRWIVRTRELTEMDDPRADYLAYAVVLKSTKGTIGSVGCSYYRDLGKVGITYFIGADYRHNGYAVEAIRAYVRFFFRNYTVEELIAAIRDENAPSWKAVERAGFTMTGRRKYRDINDDAEQMYRFYSKGRFPE